MNEQPISTPDDDVEGHMPFSKRNAFASNDSAEAPAVRGRPATDDDDVEGHGIRPRI